MLIKDNCTKSIADENIASTSKEIARVMATNVSSSLHIVDDLYDSSIEVVVAKTSKIKKKQNN
ncbi:hypothetical protein FC36_GL000345 [Ligilactobacillus equi DSM 15833 = JCM 10991]|uniref:Uncharacterized protein n=1 Tax=Ligilactobacillus equi DSM 15833 = JCM 10991 TaxID=1423740 RepID=A0A0R1TXM4_9LACO|nr:hypothetical protein [Ligilactobacillus equi]KRL83301.1 hypothetical protein FC36_GL000345 [Ligilactobacillus equi DSM 15833 = JCM 10991]